MSVNLPVLLFPDILEEIRLSVGMLTDNRMTMLPA